VSLPPWAVATPERRAHVARVAGLIDQWAVAMRVPERERARWTKAAWLHDALRDAPSLGADELAHGPAAADRAAEGGETDAGVLDAVRYHSLGYAGWDDVGRMLYLADYLEPGRTFDREGRAALAVRVPAERDAVLLEVTRRRIDWTVRSHWPLARETADFWNTLVAG
jgi:HD superfamily phosphohydrolase YqeK